MIVKLSKHSIIRARERFKLTADALIKLCKRAIRENNIEDCKDEDDKIYVYYGHFRLVMQKKSTGIYNLITLTDKQTKSSYKDKVSVNIYLKGKRTDKKMRIYRKEQ